MIKIEAQGEQTLKTDGPTYDRQRNSPELSALFSYCADKTVPFATVQDLSITLTSGKPYRLLRELGSGEDGKVVLVARESSGPEEFFAMKLFRPVIPSTNSALEERLAERRDAYRSAKNEYWDEQTTDKRKEELDQELGVLEVAYERTRDDITLELLRYRRILREISVLKSFADHKRDAGDVRIPQYEEAKFLFHPDTGNSSKLGILVMEYVPNATTLRNFLKETNPQEFSPNRVKELIGSFLAITKGLEHLTSQGVVQSDFYFEQVLVSPSHLSEPVLIDFARSLVTDLLEKQPASRGFAYDPHIRRDEVQAKAIDIDDRTTELCEKIGSAITSELGNYRYRNPGFIHSPEFALVEDLGKHALYNRVTISQLSSHLQEVLTALDLDGTEQNEALIVIKETIARYND